MGVESVTTCDTRSQRLVLPEEEPMQIGGAWLTAGERRCRLTNQLCLYCGEAGLVAAVCSVVGWRSSRKGEHMVSITSTRLPSGGRAEFLASSTGWWSCFPCLGINRLWSRGRFYGIWIGHTLGDFVHCPERTHLG